MRLALFVTPHGFGHAARACAVVSALGARVRGLEVAIWTTTPEWFFRQSLDLPWSYHREEVDVGLVQSDPFREDLEATAARLGELLPVPEARLDRLAAEVRRAGAELVLCDVSPLGLAVAARAGVPAALLENFTWDWIYAGYAEPVLEPFVAPLAALFAAADLRLQTEPVCRPVGGSLTVPPVSREPRSPVAATRHALGVPPGDRMVLVTLGGIPPAWAGLEAVGVPRGVTLVIPGGADRHLARPGMVVLPHASGFYHPDLMAAADAAVVKLGYSTVAEAWAAGVPLGYFERTRFPESPVLARFVAGRLGGVALAEGDLAHHRWATRLDEILALRRPSPGSPGGAVIAADALVELIGRAG